MNTQYSGKGAAFIQVDPLDQMEFMTATGVNGVTIPRRAQEADYLPSAYTGGFDAVDFVEGDKPLVSANFTRPLFEVYNYLLELDCRFNLRVNLQCAGLRAVKQNYTIVVLLIQSLFNSGEIDTMVVDTPGANGRINTTGSAQSLNWTFLRALTGARQPIDATQAVNDIDFVTAQCYSKCSTYRGRGQVGYAVLDTDYIGVYGDTVLKTVNYGADWDATLTAPFDALGRNAQRVLTVPISGTEHRVIVAGGAWPATYPEISYSDGNNATSGNVWHNIHPAAAAGYGGLGVNGLAMDGIGRLYAVLDSGRVCMSKDVGETYEVVEGGDETGEDLNDIAFYGTRGYIAGDANTVLLKLEDSQDWNAIAGPAAGHDLLSIETNYLGHVFIGTNGGQVWRTADGGVSYERVATNIAEVGTIDRIRRDPYTAYVMYLVHNDAASDGFIYRSEDGGVTWTPLSMVALANNGINGICAVDANTLYMCGELVGGTGFIGKFSS